ncbi:hypothetical protein Tco_0650619 [Tanacetum coccineum]
MMPKAKGLNVLSKVALTKDGKLKLATKKSKTQFYSSHRTGSGDGVDTQLEVPDEQHLKTTSADEGTGTIPGVPDVPIYESESEKESWVTMEKKIKMMKTILKIKVMSTTEYYEEEEEKIDDEETIDDEEEDKVTKELYKDVNVRLGNEDTEMTVVDQGDSEQQNVSQESGFEQVEEDAHLLNLENPSPTDNEIASLMETSAHHAMTVPKITSDFATPVIEKNVIESLEAAVLAMSSSQPKSTYEAAASLSEFELTKILLEKTEESKSHLRADYKKKLYDALFEDSRSKEKKSSSTSKDASQSQHKHSSKSAHVEEPSHTVDDSGVQQDQEFDTGNIDEQPADKEVTKAECQVAYAEEPRTAFDELMDTSFDFSAFVLNRLNIKNYNE